MFLESMMFTLEIHAPDIISCLIITIATCMTTVPAPSAECIRRTRAVRSSDMYLLSRCAPHHAPQMDESVAVGTAFLPTYHCYIFAWAAHRPIFASRTSISYPRLYALHHTRDSWEHRQRECCKPSNYTRTLGALQAPDGVLWFRAFPPSVVKIKTPFEGGMK
ncbi:hypothetical protein FA13DRAFT_1519740 [Coprinellus micaceus]|uniref:Uncharacterized protein n=1 Tax=Coprinellus micaceus TaxID=71717 RepID=A0A4Y7SLS5_COPMI|nr:hypothetical protein FA13DRAFT_1519740 [Coprinellus micaceus]